MYAIKNKEGRNKSGGLLFFIKMHGWRKCLWPAGGADSNRRRQSNQTGRRKWLYHEEGLREFYWRVGRLRWFIWGRKNCRQFILTSFFSPYEVTWQCFDRFGIQVLIRRKRVFYFRERRSMRDFFTPRRNSYFWENFIFSHTTHKKVFRKKRFSPPPCHFSFSGSPDTIFFMLSKINYRRVKSRWEGSGNKAEWRRRRRRLSTTLTHRVRETLDLRIDWGAKERCAHTYTRLVVSVWTLRC